MAAVGERNKTVSARLSPGEMAAFEALCKSNRRIKADMLRIIIADAVKRERIKKLAEQQAFLRIERIAVCA